MRATVRETRRLRPRSLRSLARLHPTITLLDPHRIEQDCRECVICVSKCGQFARVLGKRIARGGPKFATVPYGRLRLGLDTA